MPDFSKDRRLVAEPLNKLWLFILAQLGQMSASRVVR